MGSICKMTTFLTAETVNRAIGGRKKCKSERRLDGNVVLITGANTGIGKVTALELSKRGAKVVMICRNIEKAEEAINEIKTTNPTADLVLMKMDLSSLKSIRQFTQEARKQFPVIDILINNAGVMMTPEWQTEDGFEMQFGTNHLGHFLLTLHLLPIIKKSKNARIITVSSSGHLMGDIHFDNINLRDGAYNPTKSYAQSKLANVLFTRELAKRLVTNSNVKCFCLHPGPVYTDLYKHATTGAVADTVKKSILLTPEMGAQTTLYCALEESLDNESGFYYANCKRIDDMIATAVDDKRAERLWELSCDMVSLEDHLRLPVVDTKAWEEENNNINTKF